MLGQRIILKRRDEMSQESLQLSPTAAAELREILDRSLLQFPTQPGAVSPAATKQDFCNIWPTAKPILQALCGIIVFFPGFGQAAAAALTALIAAGDQIYKQTCNK